MRTLTFHVPTEYDGRMLKAFLRGHCGLSARLMAKLKRVPMGITRGGVQIKVIEPLHTGDVILLRLPEDKKKAEPVPLPLSVVYEDDDLLVIDKPAAMPMYPTPGHDRDSLANAVAAYDASQNRNLSFRPLYRLDKDTTGLVLLAKHSYAAAALSDQVEKRYFAICEGAFSGKGLIALPIRIKDGHRIEREVHASGEYAATRYHVLCSADDHSLVEYRLETGRTHQIRVHMAFLGHPLCGDDFYGGSLASIHRQALHCGRLMFRHPLSKEEITLQSPFPEDMQALCRRFDLTFPPEKADQS